MVQNQSKVLVTGAAGFIGSHLTQRLLDLGFGVVGLDNFCDFYDPPIKRNNVKSFIDHPAYQLVEGDIRDQECVNQATQGCNAVVHIAAMPGVRPSFADPILYATVNVTGTLNILEACQKHKLAMVFASSSSVYGNNDRVPFSETDPATSPISVYAATKRAGELLCHTYCDAYGLDITCLRLFTVYGPRQRPDLAIHKFARSIMKEKPIEVFGDGSMARDYTYVSDVVDGMLSALESTRGNGLRTFNIGSDSPIRLSELIEAIERAVGKKATIIRKPVPIGDVRMTWANIEAAKKGLSYSPKVDLKFGLSQFVNWIKGEV